MNQAEPDAAGNGRQVPPRVDIRAHRTLPGCLEIGRGQFLVVSGDCLARDEKIAQVVIRVGDQERPAELSRIPGGVGFWQALFVSRAYIGQSLYVGLRVKLAGGQAIDHELGHVACRDVDWQPEAAPPGAEPDSLVAICMASYEPELPAFARQIDSIRAQSHRNWLCIINDDGSSADTWQRMQACCRDDTRFRFHRNPGNLGFYHNFERALKRVPISAGFVALADQDDCWYPEKLARLIESLRARDAVLAYSDMRIVDTRGGEVAGSYWVNRRNEYQDLAVVLVANTVTGAASLFRRHLLERLLPFPPRVGDAFHDHWLACTAMSSDRLAYVDAPLYEYYQHGSSVIGHCDFVRFTLRQRFMSLLRLAGRLCRPAVAGPLLRGKYAAGLGIYRGECRRLRLIQDTIRQRARVAPRRPRTLSLFDGGVVSAARLLGLHLRILFRGQTTDDAELRLAMGEMARVIEATRGPGNARD